MQQDSFKESHARDSGGVAAVELHHVRRFRPAHVLFGPAATQHRDLVVDVLLGQRDEFCPSGRCSYNVWEGTREQLARRISPSSRAGRKSTALAGLVDHRGTGRVFLDRLNSLLCVGFRFVALAGSDDLAVRGFEVEAEFAGVPSRSRTWLAIVFALGLGVRSATKLTTTVAPSFRFGIALTRYPRLPVIAAG
jgi:hypothetical protein